MPKRLTYEFVKQYIENEGYELLSKEYVNVNTKLDMICTKGHKIQMRFGDFKNGHRCSQCSHRKALEWKMTKYKDVKQYIEKYNYELLTKEKDYINTKTNIKVKCNKGHVYITRFNTFKNGNRCPHCANNVRLDYEYVKKYIENEGCVLLSTNYINNATPLEVMCHEGHIFKVKFNNFKDNGSRCPICKETKGEKAIRKYLIQNNLNFIPQKSFDNLIGLKGGLLSYDFYLPNNNLLIEYQGSFHDGTADTQSEEEFLSQQEHDRRKKQYAIDNNIELLEIWYWDYDNIENILSNKINYNKYE